MNSSTESMIARDVAWSPVNGHGFELASIYYNEQFQLISIDGEILGVDNDLPFSAGYHILCYPNWELKEVRVSYSRSANEQSSSSATLLRSKEGQWTDHLRHPLPQFDGFTDVDISLTPLTNTLPIRRLNLQVGEARDINVLFFEAPLLIPKPARQRYTCLEKRDDGGLYRLDWEEINFTVDIPVDADGLVLDAWRRRPVGKRLTEVLPTVTLAHCDLAGGERCPEQGGRGLCRGQDGSCREAALGPVA